MALLKTDVYSRLLVVLSLLYERLGGDAPSHENFYVDPTSLGRTGAFVIYDELMNRYVWITIHRSTDNYLVYMASSLETELSEERKIIPRIGSISGKNAHCREFTDKEIEILVTKIINWLVNGEIS